MPRHVVLMAAGDLPSGGGKVVDLGRHELAVFNVDGQYHVLSNFCPHVGGPLGEGVVSQGCIVCPWHGWRFDLTTGGQALGGRKAHVYRVVSHFPDVVVELPDD